MTDKLTSDEDEDEVHPHDVEEVDTRNPGVGHGRPSVKPMYYQGVPPSMVREHNASRLEEARRIEDQTLIVVETYARIAREQAAQTGLIGPLNPIAEEVRDALESLDIKLLDQLNRSGASVEEIAGGIEFLRENLQLQDLTAREILEVLSRGPSFGMRYADRIRDEKAGIPLKGIDPEVERDQMLEELTGLPPDQKIYLWKSTVERAVEELNRGTSYALLLVQARRMKLAVMDSKGIDHSQVYSDCLREDIEELLLVLRQMPMYTEINGMTYGMTVGKAIERLQFDAEEGFELLKMYLEYGMDLFEE